MFIKTTMKYLFTPSRMAIIGQSDQLQVFVLKDKTGALPHCPWEFKIEQPLWKTVQQALT